MLIWFSADDLKMANAAAEHDCHFRWDIYDPFLPWKDLEATFYKGSPIVTQWKVTLQPLNRGINFWDFSFSLEFDKWWDRSQEIVAERLLVGITLDGIEVASTETPNHPFHGKSKRKYYFETSSDISSQNEPHHLEITIEMSLRIKTFYSNDLNEEGNGLFFHEDDLRCLSRDLGQLQNDTRHYNMVLIPRNSYHYILVHSYIIVARWNNFFALHDFEAGLRPRVETNISRPVLKDILTYMYSGTIGIYWPDWTDPAYTTELFKVIDRYKLYHLYRIFVRSDLQQLRVTRHAGIDDSKLFPLDFINGRQITVTSHSWLVSPNGLFLQVRVWNENGNNPWLSYSLKSLSSLTVYAKVCMEVVRMVNGNPLERPLLFHERYHTINPRETVESRCELSLGCLETFGNSCGTEIKYFIRCCLKATDGTTVEQIRSVDDNTLLNDLMRFNVLSDHMHRLRRQPVDDEIRIFGNSQRSKGIQGSSGLPYQANIHKGIFAIRAPEFWGGLEARPESNLPGDYVTPTLSHDTLPIVLDYMYTGKIFTNPFLFLDEVQEFASRTRFFPLLDLVNRIGLRLIG